MSSSGGFWPGEPPAFEEEEAARERAPEPAVPEPPAWPQPRPETEATDVRPAAPPTFEPPASEPPTFEPPAVPTIVEEFGPEPLPEPEPVSEPEPAPLPA